MLKKISKASIPLFFIALFTFTANPLTAGEEGTYIYHKYWIQFTDKNDNPYSIDYPDDFLSERAIQRRLKQGVAITETDLPITPRYIDSVLQFGKPLLLKSKWFNAITIETTNDSILNLIEQFDFVKKIEPVARLKLELEDDIGESYGEDEAVDHINSSKWSADQYGEAYQQLSMLRGDFLHELGYRGEGMIIAVMDAGFKSADVMSTFDSLWMQGKIIYHRDYVSPGANPFETHTHGTHVLSILGANVPGTMIGTAPDAYYMLLRTEDASSEYRIEEDNWVSAAEFADSAGADIINTSLGYTNFDDTLMSYTYADMDGSTARISIAAGLAAERGMVVVNSAGNSGNRSWRYISAPADGKNVIAVGAVDGNENRAGFSSVGPAYDGRTKPELMAMGRNTVIISVDDQVRRSNGTSFSAPVISGLIAALWQTNPSKNALEVRDAVIRSANRYYMPDSLYGYGLPDFHKAYLFLNDKPLPDILKSEKKPIAYPNPFREKLDVMLFPEKSEIVVIQMFDAFGNIVMRKETKVFKDRFNRLHIPGITNLSAGMYYLRIQTSWNQYSLKVVKI